jgi:glyoxylate carboligase
VAGRVMMPELLLIDDRRRAVDKLLEGVGDVEKAESLRVRSSISSSRNAEIRETLSHLAIRENRSYRDDRCARGCRASRRSRSPDQAAQQSGLGLAGCSR